MEDRKEKRRKVDFTDLFEYLTINDACMHISHDIFYCIKNVL